MVTPSDTGDRPLSPTVMVGDISMASAVTLAPGVLIHVAPGSRLVLEAGVCVASGTVIRVYGGTLHLGRGCSVAAGAILLGAGQVGAEACIGAGSTVVNPDVAAQAVVAAGTWHWAAPSDSPPPADFPAPSPEANPTAEAIPDADATSVVEPVSETTQPGFPPGDILATHTVIYGREQVLQLIQTLFPHRQSLSSPPP